MKLIGSKDKGYTLVSSFGQTKSENPVKPKKSENTNIPPDGGKTGPNKGRKEK